MMLRVYLVAVTALIAMMSLGVHSNDVYPQFRFKGKFIRNNSWLEISELSSNETLRCLTDLTSGVARGSWTLPNGTRLSTDGGEEIDSFTIEAGVQYLDLVPTNVTDMNYPALIGVYECSIDTASAQGEKMYIGLYTIKDNVVVEDLVFSGSGGDPPSTLTCISRRRPATTVQWRFNGTVMTDVDSTTVLDDPVTARYTHTLTLNKRVGGDYSCTVNSNDEYLARTLTRTVSINVEVASPPRSLSVETRDRTTIQLFWEPPDPLGDTVGYRIFYTGSSSGINDSITVENVEIFSEIVSNLQNGDNYFFSVAGISAHFDSEPVKSIPSPFPLLPGAPELRLSSITADSVSLTWTVPSGSVVDTYKLVWWVVGEQQPLTILSDTVSGTSDGYTIPQLDIYDNVTIAITVTAINTAGANSSSEMMVHSDILREETTTDPVPSTEPEEEDSSTSKTSNEIIIVGAIGFFLAGIVIGIVTAFIVSKLTQNCGKRHNEDTIRKPSPEIIQSPLANQPVDNGGNSLQSFGQYAHNVAYNSDVSNGTFTYDYVN